MILRASSVEKRRACRRSCPSARVVRAVSATAISNCPRAKRGRNSSCPWAFSIIDALDTTRARAPWEENLSPSPRYGARSARENLDRVAQNDAKYPVARLIYASVGAQSHPKVAPQRVAEAADTPLGDAIEAKLGGAVVDALFELVASSTELLSTPRERLIVLERKISDVKGELGLFRLAWHRVRKHARAILVAGTAVAGLLWARAAGMGPRWIH